jgi:glutathione S-transferase
MLTLHGFSTSHYYNKVKFALLEKGLPFEEQLAWAGEADLSRSPMGKVPYLDTPHGPLCESAVILEYLEQQSTQNPLLPSDAYQACKVREIAVFIDLHLELVARNLYSEAFFGGKVSDELKEKTAAQLEKGVAAFARLASFSPFVAGQTLTIADCSAVTHLPVIAAAGKLIYGKDFLAPLPFEGYMQVMAQRPSLQKINADRQANLALLTARIKARR